MVEFALIFTLLIMFTAGLLMVGRVFYVSTQVAAAARYGARWGAVIGGNCTNNYVANPSTENDWCSQYNTQGGASAGTNFWCQPGNLPLQGGSCDSKGVLSTTPSCPTSWWPSGSINNRPGCCPPNSTETSSPSPYYQVSQYSGTNATTIVGAVANWFDTNSTSYGFIRTGRLLPIDLSKVKVCIQLGYDSSVSKWATYPGDTVSVFVYYPVDQVVPLSVVGWAVNNKHLVTDLESSSQFVIE
jgi:TadE-like protein